MRQEKLEWNYCKTRGLIDKGQEHMWRKAKNGWKGIESKGWGISQKSVSQITGVWRQIAISS